MEIVSLGVKRGYTPSPHDLQYNVAMRAFCRNWGKESATRNRGFTVELPNFNRRKTKAFIYAMILPLSPLFKGLSIKFGRSVMNTRWGNAYTQDAVCVSWEAFEGRPTLRTKIGIVHMMLGCVRDAVTLADRDYGNGRFFNSITLTELKTQAEKGGPEFLIELKKEIEKYFRLQNASASPIAQDAWDKKVKALFDESKMETLGRDWERWRV